MFERTDGCKQYITWWQISAKFIGVGCVACWFAIWFSTLNSWLEVRSLRRSCSSCFWYLTKIPFESLRGKCDRWKKKKEFKDFPYIFEPKSRIISWGANLTVSLDDKKMIVVSENVKKRFIRLFLSFRIWIWYVRCLFF